MNHDLIGTNVIIRSSASGVWHGQLEATEGETCTLSQARRIWNWEGAASCSGLATHGPKAGKIPAPVPTAIINGVCEILSCTDEATARIEGIESWVA